MKDKHDDCREDRLAEAIELLARVLYGHGKRDSVSPVLNRIEQKVDTIMSAISDYTLRVNTAFDAIGTSVDAMVDSIAGVAGDIAELKRLIAELQTSSGVITPEDQALLDALESKVNLWFPALIRSRPVWPSWTPRQRMCRPSSRLPRKPSRCSKPSPVSLVGRGRRSLRIG